MTNANILIEAERHYRYGQVVCPVTCGCGRHADTFIVRGLKSDGAEVFYTGRAGDGWVSADRSEAFAYTELRARRIAQTFNGQEPLHGMWFIAVNAVPFKCAECGSTKREMQVSGIADPICCEVIL